MITGFDISPQLKLDFNIMNKILKKSPRKCRPKVKSNDKVKQKYKTSTAVEYASSHDEYQDSSTKAVHASSKYSSHKKCFRKQCKKYRIYRCDSHTPPSSSYYVINDI